MISILQYLIVLSISLLIFACSADAVDKKLILVTGCGRSGTEYMAVILRRSGIDVDHEKMAAEGCVSWPMAAHALSPWGPYIQDEYHHIFHQVRNPLHVITSWYVNLSDTQRDEWQFIRQHIPEINADDSLIVQCAKYWYYWNLKVEAIAEWRYRIEDFDCSINEFERRIGRSLDRLVLTSVPRNRNTWADTGNKITWKFLKENLSKDLYYKVKKKALNYGYDVYEGLLIR